MSKVIAIFSDGTGQAGGARPDQRLSNVYKLYRASRSGPDSKISPFEQICFYDPGLGSAEIGGPFWKQPLEYIRKLLSSATGSGFSRNVVDCYEAILRHYEPGDIIYLFGFSRGAYTVRTVGGVMNLCGVPTQNGEGHPLHDHGPGLREIAEEAVREVYEHGAGFPRAKYEDEREEKARRFRVKYACEDTKEGNLRGNVCPYFIGVFDTVSCSWYRRNEATGYPAVGIACRFWCGMGDHIRAHVAAAGFVLGCRSTGGSGCVLGRSAGVLESPPQEN